ncbi:Protein of unknown function [Dyadobacter koreensis]|uniref:DUF3826 domain-containing protein n=1 Tax=Dyadobacter koreensis TaxID=408657 RepID=A0A1H6Y0M5_9BACT|nr:DUF3826 domain-containing protein [Dyadobacter koreensis]SEJ30355.1 Protein of unknown function [Dyadobacter koreensis]
MKKFLTVLTAILLAGNVSFGQNSKESDDAYVKTITQRAEKILAAVNLTDSVKYKKVRDVIVSQYLNLNKIHEEKNSQINSEKTKEPIDKEQRDRNLKLIEEEAGKRLFVLHKEYVKQLSSNLTKEQVGQVKDGMTYGVLNVTYKAYSDMIPSLKPLEKEQILTWLTEARELAMDAGTSDGKHQIFGKYKGRINNYLSSAGYDIQKERKAWEERLKVSKSNGR